MVKCARADSTDPHTMREGGTRTNMVVTGKYRLIDENLNGADVNHRKMVKLLVAKEGAPGLAAPPRRKKLSSGIA